MASSTAAGRLALTGRRLKRWLAIVFIVAYPATMALHVGRQFLGDTDTNPFGQLFVWDMFPNTGTHDIRHLAVGLTRHGRFVQLVPGPGQRYRGGRDGDLARTDFLPDSSEPPWRRFFRQAVEDALAASADALRDDPITMVLLAEGARPVHFNLPDDWFQAEYGRPNPHRISWRLIEQAAVSKDGRPNWSTAP